jgi:hypothetical protein
MSREIEINKLADDLSNYFKGALNRFPEHEDCMDIIHGSTSNFYFSVIKTTALMIKEEEGNEISLMYLIKIKKFILDCIDDIKKETLDG